MSDDLEARVIEEIRADIKALTLHERAAAPEPGQVTIYQFAKREGITEQTAGRHLIRLVEAGLWAREKRHVPGYRGKIYVYWRVKK